VSLRHDWGPQYRSVHFLGSLRWLGMADDAAYVGEPESNGCAERWIKTLKEQCLLGPAYPLSADIGRRTRRRARGRLLERPERRADVGQTTRTQAVPRSSGRGSP
jgi:transposase InsO family protein